MALSGSYIDHHLETFKDTLLMEFQQKGSVLRPTVNIETLKGNRHSFDKTGVESVVEKVVRNQKKSYTDPTKERRTLTFEYFTFDRALDDVDLADMVSDPRSEYVRGAVFAHGRKNDKIIADALLGSQNVETNGTAAATALPSGQKVAVNSHLYDAAGGTNDIGLTEFKLNHALKIISANHAFGGSGTIYCVTNSNQLSGLKMVTQVTSGDYRSSRPLEGPGVDSSINGFLGMTFIKYEDFDLDANSDERAVVYTEDAIKMGIRKPLSVEILKDTTLVGNPDTISVTEDFGCARMYEEAVVEIACDPTTFVSA